MLPRARLGLVEHRTAPRVPAGSWSSWLRHGRWVCEYADQRGQRQQVEGAVFDRLPQCWHLYAPGTGYRERYPREDCVREDLWFFLDPGAVPPPLRGRAFTVILDPEERLLRLARSMYLHQQEGRPGREMVLHGLLIAALGEILIAGRAGGAGTPAEPWRIQAGGPRSPGLAQRIDAEVLRDLAHPPRLGDLAERLGCSASGLAHGLRREAGITVLARIRWLRIREARRLLADGVPAKAVAARLGFASASHFAQVFRRETGLTPGGYRSRILG